MAKKEQNKAEQMSFEQTIKELGGIVEKIEQGQIPLAESLGQYERGMVLIKHCRGILEKAEMRIEKISAQQPKQQANDD